MPKATAEEAAAKVKETTEEKIKQLKVKGFVYSHDADGLQHFHEPRSGAWATVEALKQK